MVQGTLEELELNLRPWLLSTTAAAALLHSEVRMRRKRSQEMPDSR